MILYHHTDDTIPPLVIHPMITRSKMGITKPNLKYALLTNCSSEKDPKGLEDALNNPVWLDAMHEELRALNQDNTWFLFHARQT